MLYSFIRKPWSSRKFPAFLWRGFFGSPNRVFGGRWSRYVGQRWLKGKEQRTSWPLLISCGGIVKFFLRGPIKIAFCLNCFPSVTFLADHGEICAPHGWSTWRPADQPATHRSTWTSCLFKENHTRNPCGSVWCGLVCGSPCGSPMWGANFAVAC